MEAVGEVERLHRALAAVGLPARADVVVPRARLGGEAAAAGHEVERGPVERERRRDLLAGVRDVVVVEIRVRVHVRAEQPLRAGRQPAVLLEVDDVRRPAALRGLRVVVPDLRGRVGLDHVHAPADLAAAGVDERVPDLGGGRPVRHPPDQPALVEGELRGRAVVVGRRAGGALGGLALDGGAEAARGGLHGADGLAGGDGGRRVRVEVVRRVADHVEHAPVGREIDAHLAVGGGDAVDGLPEAHRGDVPALADRGRLERVDVARVEPERGTMLAHVAQRDVLRRRGGGTAGERSVATRDGGPRCGRGRRINGGWSRGGVRRRYRNGR